MVQRRFGSKHSERAADLLVYVHRAKRVMRKALSGNLTRELRLRQMTGLDTCWLAGAAGRQTCQKLAYL